MEKADHSKHLRFLHTLFVKNESIVFYFLYTFFSTLLNTELKQPQKIVGERTSTFKFFIALV